jgi:hypothetical protein
MMNPPAPPPPHPHAPQRKRHWVRWTLITIAALIAAGTAAGLAGGSPQPQGRPAASAATSPASTPPAVPAAAPAPAPSPDGTYQGSCDTRLGAGISDPNYLIGQVDLANTGNIGTVIRVRFAWKQEGYPDITMTKTTRTRPGQSRTVDFRYYAGTFATSTAPLDQNQSWQENHGFKDPCTYHARIVATFGQAHAG